jgi:hypothetical protein
MGLYISKICNGEEIFEEEIEIFLSKIFTLLEKNSLTGQAG